MKTYKNIIAVLFIGFITVSLFGFAEKAKAIPPSSYSISVTSGPTVVGRDASMSGIASATNYVGQYSQYGIAINWGDGTPVTNYPNLSALGFTNGGGNFSGSWPTSLHTYAYPGSYSAQVKLYKGNVNSVAKASANVQIDIICTPQFPPFEAPC